jgi:hypothetical protein
MDTLKFVYALQAEGMDEKQAGVIAHELYALYAHSVLGGKYNEVDYGDYDALKERARKVREEKAAHAEKVRKFNEELRQEREARAARQAVEPAADAKFQESFRETNAYLKVRLELNQEQKRLDFVLEHGVPMQRAGQFCYHGWSHLGWFTTQRAAIDAAVKYPPEAE